MVTICFGNRTVTIFQICLQDIHVHEIIMTSHTHTHTHTHTHDSGIYTDYYYYHYSHIKTSTVYNTHILMYKQPVMHNDESMIRLGHQCASKERMYLQYTVHITMDNECR